MTNVTTKHRNAVPTPIEVEFVRQIEQPEAVLSAIERGKAAVAKANGAIELAAAVAGTWMEIAELEGPDIADTITEQVWPLDGSTVEAEHELAAAA